MSIESGATTEQKKEEKVLELFDLSEQQKSKLRDEVKKHKGLVRVFIHPVAKLKSGKEIENKERVSDILGRTILSEKTPPIIVFENAGAIEGWKKSIEKHAQITKNIYIVSTILDYPYPIVPGKPEPSERDENGYLQDKDDDYIEEGVTMFIEFLKDAGVKKIMVGGTNLEVIDDKLNRCVGNFIRAMKYIDNHEIDIKLSLGTAPLNKQEIKKIRPDLVEGL
jgi:hypothetical protein